MPKDMHTKKIIRRLQNKPKNEEHVFRHCWEGSSMETSMIVSIDNSNIPQAQNITVIEGRCLFGEEEPDYPCYDTIEIMHSTETYRYV